MCIYLRLSAWFFKSSLNFIWHGYIIVYKKKENIPVAEAEVKTIFVEN